MQSTYFSKKKIKLTKTILTKIIQKTAVSHISQ